MTTPHKKWSSVLWLVQTGLRFSDFVTPKMAEVFNTFDIKWGAFPLIPFSDTIPRFHTEDDQQVIYYGSTKLVQCVNDKSELKKSAALFFDPQTHATSWYGPRFGKDYLNADAKLMTAEELANSPLSNKDIFVRPNVGIKLFPGKVMDVNTFRNIYNAKAQVGSVEMKPETLVLVNEPITIYREYRTWWIDGEVAAVVLYNERGTIAPRMLTHEDDEQTLLEVSEFSRQQGLKIPEVEAFVLDVAMISAEYLGRGMKEYKVVEINCVHSSGFYHVDTIEPVICKLTDYVRNRKR